jgi:hypothetical protein
MGKSCPPATIRRKGACRWIPFAAHLAIVRAALGGGMDQERHRGLEKMAALPWPAGLLAGLLVFMGIRFGLGSYFANVDSAWLRDLAREAAAGTFNPHAWAALGVCWLGALGSYVGDRHRRQLQDARARLEQSVALRRAELDGGGECPRCGAGMIRRADAKAGQVVWGCSAKAQCEDAAALA